MARSLLISSLQLIGLKSVWPRRRDQTARADHARDRRGDRAEADRRGGLARQHRTSSLRGATGRRKTPVYRRAMSTKQSTPQCGRRRPITRHCEERSDEAIHAAAQPATAHRSSLRGAQRRSNPRRSAAGHGPSVVIARSAATKQSTPQRSRPRPITRHCEERSDEAIHAAAQPATAHHSSLRGAQRRSNPRRSAAGHGPSVVIARSAATKQSTP